MEPSSSLTAPDIHDLNARIREQSSFLDTIRTEVGRALIGQSYMVERLLIGLLSGGHILLEGVPGLAKTLAIKSLASAVDAEFNRIQFTPDLLPADLVGTMIYNPQESGFQVKKGPIFANFILADEINRSPAKVQSALLEAMAEKQVTIGSETYRLPSPFLVMATQNPIEQEGTYTLPEAQVDRFMLKCVITYPNKQDERQIIRQAVNQDPVSIRPVVSLEQVFKARELIKEVYMDEKIEQYILDLIFATRNPEASGLSKLKHMIAYGGSPRASINLALAAKAHAFLQHRGFVIPEDVRAVCPDVMRHRIGLTYEAEAENVTQEDLIVQLLDAVEVP